MLSRVRSDLLPVLGLLGLLAAAPVSAGWLSDMRLTNDANDSRTSYNNAWCVAVNGDTLHVVWFDNRAGGVYGIYYKRSTDDGVTWSSDTLLTGSASAQYPCIAASGGRVHIAWEDIRDGNYEIYYKSSTDCGTFWGADQRLTVNSAQSWYPSIAVSDSNLDVVWEDGRSGYYNVWEKHSTDWGSTWSDDEALTTNAFTSSNPAVAIAGSGIYVVWCYSYINAYDIQFRRSTNLGASWDSTRTLSATMDFASSSPTLAVAGTQVNVVWQYTLVNPQVMYQRSTNLGATWLADTALTNGSYSAVNPTVAARDSQVHVVWQDNRDGNQEIYYKRSLHRGLNWDADTRLTRDTWSSQYPSTAAGPRNLYVVWQDNRPGNDEIYFKEYYTPDVAATGIIAPTGSVDKGQVIAPRASVRNNGTQTAIFPVAFNISDGYSNVQTCTLNTGQAKTVAFADWTADSVGSWTTKCTTRLTGDVAPGNDRVTGTVNVVFHDVGCTRILAPVGTIDSGTDVWPQAVVTNHGTSTETFSARFVIGSIFAESMSATVPAGRSDTITYDYWTAYPLGMLVTRCSTMLATDQNHGNDKYLDSVIVVPLTGIEQANPKLPTRFELAQPAPNPFSGRVGLRLALPRAAPVELAVYSVTGACVRTLQEANLPPGYYHLTWDGCDRFGRPVQDGIYFCRLAASGFSSAQRVVKLR